MKRNTGTGGTFSTATWKCSSVIAWLVLLENEAKMLISRDPCTRSAVKSMRSCEFSTWIPFFKGSALLGGSDDAKFHSSSSPVGFPAAWGGEGAAPAKSSNAEEADAACACGAGCWKGLPPGRGLADTKEANGSAAGGGVAVVWI